MRIVIKTIKHNKHRYPTVGDWWFDKNGNLEVRVSRMEDRRYVVLVALHEVIEALLCDERGITDEDVTKFDVEFERERKSGDTREPGDQFNAPYYKEHKFASRVERLIAGELEVDWNEYEKEVNSL